MATHRGIRRSTGGWASRWVVTTPCVGSDLNLVLFEPSSRFIPTHFVHLTRFLRPLANFSNCSTIVA